MTTETDPPAEIDPPVEDGATPTPADVVDPEDEIDNVPDKPPPAVIQSAQYDVDGVSVMLTITEPEYPVPHQYALNQTDPYGLSPFLREELDRLVNAGEITIQPPPPLPSE